MNGRAMWVGRARTFAFCLAMTSALFLLLSLHSAQPADGVTRPPFTVNLRDSSLNDLDFPGGTFDGSSDGKCDVDAVQAGNQCTLRAAIQQANRSRGADVIKFSIPDSQACNATTKVCFISVYGTSSGDQELPPITEQVTIDGYTQGDATADPADDAKENTLPEPGKTNADLKIMVYGEDVGAVPEGLVLDGASNSVIRGLVIGGFRSAITFSSGTGYRVEGNFIGTDASGNMGFYNADAGVSVYSSNTIIGGASPAARNLISFNHTAIHLQGGKGNKVEGNLIGTNTDGTNTPRDLGNFRSVVVDSPSSNNLIGDSDRSDGSLTNAANTIAFNDSVGVSINFNGTTGNRILSNSIFSNGDLGIDLSEFNTSDGVTANDPDDPATSKPDPDKDTGPNSLQNFPEITKAEILLHDPLLGNTATIEGYLDSVPSRKIKRHHKTKIIRETYTIQFFASPEDPLYPSKNDPSGYGEGKRFLGQKVVSTDLQGKVTFTFSATGVSEGEIITATATRNRTGDTSEFSNAEEVTDPGPVVGG